MRVYIVESSEIIRIRLASLLAEIKGVELVGQTGSAEMAAENIMQLSPDVVLAEIKLPDGNGLDLFASAKARGLNARFIAMTFSPHRQYRKKASELGVAFFVDKANRLESIRPILEQMVAEECAAEKVA